MPDEGFVPVDVTQVDGTVVAHAVNLALPNRELAAAMLEIDPGGAPHSAVIFIAGDGMATIAMSAKLLAALYGFMEAYWAQIVDVECPVDQRDQLNALRAHARREYDEKVLAHPGRR